MAVHESYAATMTISTEERSFFVSLGERIAALRREHGVTQVQLAEALGVSQQTMQSYEVGRRIPVSALPAKRGPAPRFQERLERLVQLPRTQQRLVMDMLDAALGQPSR